MSDLTSPTQRLKEADSPCGQLPLSDAERERMALLHDYVTRILPVANHNVPPLPDHERERLADPSLAVVDAMKELRESHAELLRLLKRSAGNHVLGCDCGLCVETAAAIHRAERLQGATP